MLVQCELMSSRNTSASSRIAEQQDIVRSILILRQVQPHPSSKPDVNLIGEQEKETLEAPRDVKESITQTLKPKSLAQTPKSPDVVFGSRQFATPRTIKQETKDLEQEKERLEHPPGSKKDNLLAEVSGKPSEDSTQVASGISTPLGPNSSSKGPRVSSPDIQAPKDQQRAVSPNTRSEAKIVELNLYSLDPQIRADFTRVTIAWNVANARISEDEIHKQAAKNQADGLTSGLAMLEALRAFERSLVIEIINLIQMENPREQITFLSLKRTEEDLQHGSMVFKAVPSFQLIIQHNFHSRPQRQMGNKEGKDEADVAFKERVIATFGAAGYSEESIEKVLKKGEKAKRKQSEQTMDLQRPTYIRVHKKHLSPETLDDYNLPWVWDDVSP